MLRRIEQRLARLVEGTFGRMSRTGVQPVELARRLVREMDDNQQPSVSHTYAPNVYEVFLAPVDHARLCQYSTALSSELAEYLALHARRNGYTLLSRPTVRLNADDDLDRGSFGIACEFDESARAAMAQDGGTGQVQRTQVMQAVAAAPRLHLLVPGAGVVSLAGERVTIGRGKANDIVLPDNAASREHAEIVNRGDTWVLRDRGSTNGTSINGAKVSEHPLQSGDTIEIGSTRLRVEDGR